MTYIATYLTLVCTLGYLCFIRRLYTVEKSSKYSILGVSCLILGDICAGLHLFGRFNTDLEWPLNFALTMLGQLFLSKSMVLHILDKDKEDT